MTPSALAPRPSVIDSRDPPAGSSRSGAHLLLEAKLSIPRPRPGTVRRTRLLRQLRAARDRRVISIVAPPGYGKTSLLVQWTAQDPRSVAWLTADHGDNDPVVFLTYLAAAIDRIEPLDPDLFRAIGSLAVSPRTVVGRILVALQRRAQPVLIVIDDAHRLTDQTCLDALGELITYLPEGSKVVIVGREPVALPFPRWRAEGLMLEFGPDELAMDEQEAAGLGRKLGVRLSADAATHLARQTEGWPALLALATLESRRSPDRDAQIDPGSDRVIADYLRSEVLEGRPADEIAFLLHTSILERLSGPLCDAVTDRRRSDDLLARLAGSTLLVDAYGGSYRYHVLLRDFLRGELTAREPERVAGLHERAAAWYEATGALDHAVDHAFAAGNVDLAAALAGEGMLLYHWSGRRATTRAWFRRFGDDALRERPWLAILAAWEALGAGDVASSERLADIAELGTFDGRPPDGTASFESGRAMLRASMCRAGADDALANANLAVDLERAGSPWRDFSLWQLALALRTKGDRQGADEALADAVVAARSTGNVGLTYCLVGHRAQLAADRADWTAAAALVDEDDELAASANIEGYLSSAPARAAQARIAIHHGDIEGARLGLAQAMSLRPLLTAACPGLAVESLLAFAQAHLAIGDAAGARTLLAQAGQVIRSRPDLGILPREVAALRATIASLPIGVAGASSLTASELRVLALLPYYLSFKEIGERLGVKATTVKTHALAIYGKLGASTRSEAVDLAVDAGLLERFPT
jgi:LuxR family transcriptional regulator, maltose regulon positive regulatory protein